MKAVMAVLRFLRIDKFLAEVPSFMLGSRSNTSSPRGSPRTGSPRSMSPRSTSPRSMSPRSRIAPSADVQFETTTNTAEPAGKPLAKEMLSATQSESVSDRPLLRPAGAVSSPPNLHSTDVAVSASLLRGSVLSSNKVVPMSIATQGEDEAQGGVSWTGEVLEESDSRKLFEIVSGGVAESDNMCVDLARELPQQFIPVVDGDVESSIVDDAVDVDRHPGLFRAQSSDVYEEKNHVRVVELA